MAPKRKASKRKASASTVDYDSDEEPPNTPHCLWRQPMEISHSDWTVEITVENNDEGVPPLVSVYHVHKYLLAASGRRSCNYFTQLFQIKSERYKESRSQKSQISLKAPAAEAFPVMLDYVYSLSKPLKINTDNATALHFLGQYFQNQSLRWESGRFWRGDLQVSNCHIYYEHACLFKNEKILDAVAKVCLDNLFRIKPDSDIIQVVHPTFWRGLFKEAAISNKEESLHISHLVTEVCSRHHANITSHLFSELTKDSHLPQIDHTCAANLILLYNSHQRVTLDHTTKIVDENEAGDESAIRESSKETGINDLSGLKLRYLDALVENWRVIATSPESTDSLGKHTSFLLSNLHKRVVSKANDQLVTTEQMLEHTENLASDLQSDLIEARGEIADRDSTIERLTEGSTKAATELAAANTEIKRLKCGNDDAPFQVVISGAGEAAVNGVYTRHADNYRGSACYVMKIGKTKYWVLRLGPEWAIASYRTYPPETVNESNIVYTSRNDSMRWDGDLRVPPRSGWILSLDPDGSFDEKSEKDCASPKIRYRCRLDV